MLSESCAPLYPPAVVYQQLMYERKSRINACDSEPNFYRDNYRQAASPNTPPHFTLQASLQEKYILLQRLSQSQVLLFEAMRGRIGLSSSLQ
jgi:hypothetical protein